MTPNTPAGGAVAWQERPAGGGFEMCWMNCSREEYERLKGSPLYEVRPLYTTPPATVPLDAVLALVAEARALLDFLRKRSAGPAPYYKPSGLEWDQVSQVANALSEHVSKLEALTREATK